MAIFVFAVQIVGVFEKDGQKLPHSLTGKWDTALEVEQPGGQKERIWEVHPRPADTSRYAHTLWWHGSGTCLWPLFLADLGQWIPAIFDQYHSTRLSGFLVPLLCV